MQRQAVFVDLANFYSHLLRSGIGEPSRLRDYFLCWLDLDRLARALTGDFSPVWVFYSGKRLGPGKDRVQGDDLRTYVDRINSLKGVTAYDVAIEGTQREHASYKCDNCGHEGVAQWESEKGIDASLTVHLFDTMDTWDAAYLLSADADFVPAVRTLRRRGKIVVGAGFSARSSALVQECYDYVDLHPMFLQDDLAAYEMFRQGGTVQAWLADPVVPQLPEGDPERPVELSAHWQGLRADRLDDYGWESMREVSEHQFYHLVQLMATGSVDLSGRLELVSNFQAVFPEYVTKIDPARNWCQLAVSPLAWHGVERRLEAFGARLEGASIEGPWSRLGRWTITYQYDATAGGYVVVPPEPPP
ncbi:MAG TPA: NYN domain-containing protein [Anaerolineae bacterium]|nr:NYN domain-containing protein [Anaerolineae bacterium]